MPKQTHTHIHTAPTTGGVAGTHPAPQAVVQFAGDLLPARFWKQPRPAARAGAEHAPQLQHALFRPVTLVPVVLQKEKSFFKETAQVRRGTGTQVLAKC